MKACSSLLHTNAEVKLLVCHSSQDVVPALDRSRETIVKLHWLSPCTGHLIAEQRLSCPSPAVECKVPHTCSTLQEVSDTLQGWLTRWWVNNHMMEWLNTGICVRHSCSLSPLTCFFSSRTAVKCEEVQVSTCLRFCWKPCAFRHLWKAIDKCKTWEKNGKACSTQNIFKKNPSLNSKLIPLIT